MVKGLAMLISEFARAAGLTPDTVRFYVRLGLLRPGAGAKGGRHAYQVFTESDVSAAKVIRLSQAAGLSLKDIAAIGEERRAGRMTTERRIDVVSAQIDRLDARAAELRSMADYLRAKRDWLVSGERGDAPKPAFAPA
jgi:DNA-binding transcriptional MerR regulator